MKTSSIIKAEQQSLLYLHMVVFLFGGTALFSKLIGLPALDITVYRTAIALLILLTLQKKQLTLASMKDYGIAILLGCVVGIHWVTYFTGMQMAGVTVGIIAFFTYPVITVFIEPLFNKTVPKVKDMITALMVIIGIVLLIPEVSFGNQVTLGIVTGIISAVFFALRNILQKKYFAHYSGPHTMLYQTLVACLMLCLFVFASSLRYLSATTAGLLSCLQPLYGSVLAFFLLHERPDLLTIIGGLLVISAAIYETWSVSKGR
jgi:drug/metabolite transporter (DMT)-like permease